MPVTLVTGATGFIGSHVVELLVARGDDVRVTVRQGSSERALADLPVAKVRADVRDRRAIRRAMRGIERVFHLAGTTSLTMPRERVFAVNLEGTRIVLEEALRASVERVVYTSSVAAVGPAPPGEVADEASAWDAGRLGLGYVDSKHEAEATAMRLFARGLPVVIVNPTTVMGPGDPGRSSTALVRRFLRRQIPAYVDGTLNIVGVDDVARGHVLADEQGHPGERYILGNRNYTVGRLLADLGRMSGVEPPVLRLPVPVALAAAAAARRVGLPAPVPAEILAASLNWAFSNRKAKRELGWRTSPHEDSLEATVAWYREQYAGALAAPGSRQPFALRVGASVLRRAGLAR